MRYRFKTPWRDGTTDVVLEPLDFLARLAALVPRPRINLTRFHGLFAPNSRLRARITPARRGRGAAIESPTVGRDEAPSGAASLASSRWARRLKRVFGIDVESCPACGARLRILACIEDRSTVDAILTHLACKASAGERLAARPRAPPADAPPPPAAAHRLA